MGTKEFIKDVELVTSFVKRHNKYRVIYHVIYGYVTVKSL